MAARGHEERRLVTSLFIDVVGSTELTVSLGPERLKAALDRAFVELRGVIEHEGGTVEKYIGDAIYALFGAPLAHPDDPERALRAAAGARAWAASRSAAEIPFGVRVGLETGEAIVDLAAAADTKQQMSVGAVVNTAARLQQRAEPGQVLVGPVAHETTVDIATFTPLGTVELKGLGALAVWALEELRGTSARRRLPFVGRDPELELLNLASRRAKTRSVLALVSGPPGQGKTRLVEEFLAGNPEVRLFAARCRPGGEVGALAPLRELLLGDRGEDALEVLVAEAIEDPAERTRVRDALAHSAGIRASRSLAGLGKNERDDELLNAWRKLVRGLAAQRPIALWVEDVHWAAPEVVALIDRLSLAGEPVLVIATARPEFAEAAGIRPSGDRFFIGLDALEPESARALASSAGRDDAGAIARAGGNPLFIVELARALDPSGDLPLTLQGALGARLDDLDADDRALLAHGAVVGETFAPADAAMLSGRDAVGAARALTRLAERQYLDPVDGRYRFHHSLLRDVAYGRLLAADRMGLHARFAREARLDDVEVIAHHWWAALGGAEAEWVWHGDDALAGMRRDAHLAHLAAGRKQGALFAADRAAAFFDRAYALADDERGRAEAKHGLADAYAQDLHGDDAWQAYQDAREHYLAAGGAPAELYIGALKVLMRIGSFRRVPTPAERGALAVEGQKIARAGGDPGILARVLVYSAFRDMDPGSEVADPELLAEALRLSERSDPATRREILGWEAENHIRAMRIADALAVFEKMEALPGATTELDRMEYLRGRALIALRRGSLPELASVAERLWAASRQAGPHLRTHAEVYASQLAFARGEWSEVARLATDTDQLIQTSPATVFCVSAGIMLANGAVVHARAGRPDEARALIRRVDEIAYEKVVRDALKAMGLAFTGDRVAIDATPQNVTTRLPFLAAAAVATRRHDEALTLADALESDARDGARFYAALAQAVREEVARDGGGAAPTHALLRDIGYVGWSDVLSARA
ncbi:MAG TPA: AAA family ATPase [Candidatus Limnocylindria bacterium]